MKINIILVLTVLICAATVMTASAATRIGVLTDGESDFWTTLHIAMQEAVKEQDVEIDFQKVIPATVERQEEMLREMAAAGTQVLAIAPINPEKQAPLLKELAAKTVLVTLIRDVPDSGRIVFLGRDEKEVGKLLAQGVLQHLPPGVKVMAFCKDSKSAATQARTAGLEETFEEAGTVLDSVKADKGDRMIAAATMEEVIKKHPEIAALIGFEPYHGAAMVRAVTEGNRARMVRIVGFGSTPEVKAALQKGIVHTLVSDDAAGWGTLLAKTLLALAANEKEGIPEDGFIAAPLKTTLTEGGISTKDLMNEMQIQAPWISEITSGTQ